MSVTPAFRRRLLFGLIVASGVLAARVGLRAALVRYMALPARCGHACAAGDESCAPVRLTLELRDAHARVKKMPRIWYRASISNVGCGDLEIPGDFFRYGHSFEIDQSRGSDFYFRITDSAGAAVSTPHATVYDDGKIGVYGDKSAAPSAIVLGSADAAPREFPLKGAETAGVEPYDVDETTPGRWRDRDGATLAPGETLTALPTRYWPHRRETVASNTASYVGTASVKVPAKLSIRIAPEPPAGFRLLERIVFLRPGRYHVRLAFNGSYSNIGEYRYQRLPLPAYRLLTALARAFDVPPPAQAKGSTSIESEPVEIEVLP